MIIYFGTIPSTFPRQHRSTPRKTSFVHSAFGTVFHVLGRARALEKQEAGYGPINQL